MRIELGDSDWQDVCELLAYVQGRTPMRVSNERTRFLQERISEQLTARRAANRRSRSMDFEIRRATEDAEKIVIEIYAT